MVFERDHGLYYTVKRAGNTVVEPSRLGFESDLEDFTRGFSFQGEDRSSIDETYPSRGKKAVYETAPTS